MNKAESDFTTQTGSCSKQLIVESLQLQQRNCLLQIEHLTARLIELQLQLSTASTVTMNESRNTESLKQAIYEQVDQQDSLLTQLGYGPKKVEHIEPTMTASKCPKDDHIVIEELRLCNQELRRLIAVLLEELEAKTAELNRLKANQSAPNYQSTNQSDPLSHPPLPVLEFEPLDLPTNI